MSADQANLFRDARGMPSLFTNPREGETSQEALTSRVIQHRIAIGGVRSIKQMVANTVLPLHIGQSRKDVFGSI